MLIFIVTLLLAGSAGVVVGLLAWRGFLGRWRNVLAPVILLAIIVSSAAVFLNVAAAVIKRP